ncbi:low temperature requirement protein A [Gryllotalpicola reticulitermitis]|uniref:Low temperature requirement protein A n=1 Tax=Gryllotalpicola reticulitermitis TaxID=1184153 RepID=A0ABV8Q072_9MICO
MRVKGLSGLTRDTSQLDVTPVELFFDLVYVFAVSQLSAHLLENPNWPGVAQTAILYLAVFTVWSHTSWAITLTDVGRAPVWWMLLITMWLGLLMNTSISRAFSTAGWAFALVFVILQIGRNVWLIVIPLDPVVRAHFRRYLVWVLATAPLWIVGGFLSGRVRLVLWAIAALVDLAGSLAAHPLPGRRFVSRGVAFAGEHLLERTRLFFLIALGETVLTTGTAVVSAGSSPLSLLSGTLALAGSVALWWLYFHRVEGEAQRTLRSSQDPQLLGRYTIYALMVGVWSLILIAVADERVIAHPLGDAGLVTNLMLFGGPILFLAAQGCYVWITTGKLWRTRPVGAIALAAVGALTIFADQLTALTAVTVVLILLAIVDGHAGRASADDTEEAPAATRR